MHEIEIDEMSEEFLHCWKAAGAHLNKQVENGIRSWLRAHPYPPFLEHLSFRLGNQLFFVRVEDIDGRVQGPGNPRGFLAAANNANTRAHACILFMRQKQIGGTWEAVEHGWGLLDAGTRKPINPRALITRQNIEMSPWEIHDMAVQVVRDYLAEQGFELMSWQSDPEVDPSIWFIGESKLPEWVVVRSAIFPSQQAARPSNWQEIAVGCSKLSNKGHFASVALVSVDQPFESSIEAPVPLWRGNGMHVRFTGLE